MTEARMALAEWLLDVGAGESVHRALGNLPGFRAGNLRNASADVSLLPTVYGLVVLSDGTALVVPLRPVVGRSAARDPSFRDACAIASERARQILGAPALPDHHFKLEEVLEVEGSSIALPAALAIIAETTYQRLKRPVLATGALDGGGRIGPVGHLAAKVAIALAERASAEPTILIPAATSSIEPRARAVEHDVEAVELVFGTRAPLPDPSRVGLDEVIARARRAGSPADAVSLLAAVPAERLSIADRAKLTLELGTALRHAGRSADAVAAHCEARRLLEQGRRVIGAESSERYELEMAATRLDGWELEPLIDHLTRRLTEPFVSLHNELRVRGLLAQALGMAGRSAEAVVVREANLALHDLSEELGRTRAGTLCYLVLDSALAGEHAASERWREKLVQAIRPGDDHQWRYAAMVIIRSLVLAGRNAEAIRFAIGRRTIAGVCAPTSVITFVNDTSPVTTHPEVSTLRALLRAARQRGDRARLEPWVSRLRVEEPLTGLLAWIHSVARLERSLADDELGRPDDAASTRATARSTMRSAHAAACLAHAALLADNTALSPNIDRIWY